jgi:competence protein ComEA
MFEFDTRQRMLLVVFAVLGLAGIGWGVRKSRQTPSLTWVSSAQASTPLSGDKAQRLRTGGASPGPGANRSSGLIVVHVAGAVRKPGVYTLHADKRVVDALRQAGGPALSADLNALNLAAPMTDGQQILVPQKEKGVVRSASPHSRPLAYTGPININTASEVELDRLPGVGPATARKIIEYRTQSGPFSTPDDLLNVKGIGPKKLARMRDSVRVR